MSQWGASNLAYVLIVVGTLFSLMNWGTLVASWRSKRFVSAVPLVGALPLGWGLALLPATRSFAWLALVADYGTLVLIIGLPRLVYDLWSTSRINLLHCFTATAADRIIAVKLFRRHIAVISARFDPPVPCGEVGSRVGALGFGLVGRWSATETGFSIDGYGSDRHLVISEANGIYTTAELNYPTDNKYKYDCLDRLVVRKQDDE